MANEKKKDATTITEENLVTALKTLFGDSVKFYNLEYPSKSSKGAKESETSSSPSATVTDITPSTTENSNMNGAVTSAMQPLISNTRDTNSTSDIEPELIDSIKVKLNTYPSAISNLRYWYDFLSNGDDITVISGIAYPYPKFTEDDVFNNFVLDVKNGLVKIDYDFIETLSQLSRNQQIDIIRSARELN